MGLAAKLTFMPEYQERQAERVPVNIDAQLRELGANWADVHVHDISTHGAMVEADDLYPTGSYVWLKLPGVGAVNARLLWRDCFRYGCEFVTPLDREQWSAAADLFDDGIEP